MRYSGTFPGNSNNLICVVIQLIHSLHGYLLYLFVQCTHYGGIVDRFHNPEKEMAFGKKRFGSHHSLSFTSWGNMGKFIFFSDLENLNL